MAFIVKDRVKEQVAAPGTGAITCVGTSLPGYQNISDVMTDGDIALFCIRDSRANWQTFVGTWTAATNTLTRTINVDGIGGRGVTVNIASDSEVWMTFAASENPRELTAASFGAVGDGVTDDTAALQALASALKAIGGGVGYIGPGTYLVSSSILLSSYTWLRGAGPLTKIYAVRGSNWVFNVIDAGGVNPNWTTATSITCVFANENYAQENITDSNITISDMSWDLDAANSSQRKAGVWFVSVSDTHFFNLTTNGGGGVIAHLHSARSNIHDCQFYDFHSTACDHYSTFNDAWVTDCYFRQTAVSSNNPPIQFTGTIGTSQGVVCTGNRIFCTGGFLNTCMAIGVTAAAGAGVTNNVMIAHNDIDMDGLNAGGVICYGGGDNWNILHNTIRNVDDYNCILAFSNGFSAVTRVRIEGNRIMDCTRTSGSGTLISTTSDGSSVLNNDALDCTCTTVANCDGAGGVLSNGSLDGTTYTNAFTVANGAKYLGQITGTWTPVVTFGGASTGITYSTQTGNFIRNGDMVYIDCVLVLTSKGSATGSAHITGQPYPDVSGSNPPSRMHIRTFTNTNGITEDPMIRVSDNELVMAVNARGGANVDDTNFANNTNLSFCGWYRA